MRKLTDWMLNLIYIILVHTLRPCLGVINIIIQAAHFIFMEMRRFLEKHESIAVLQV